MIRGLGRRMRDARLAAARRLNRTVSQAAMADLVTAELERLGSDVTVSQAAWSAYEREANEPSTMMIFTATALVSGLDERDIAFGPRVSGEPVDDATEQVSQDPGRARRRGDGAA